jgi:hypothetical protein
VTIDVLGNDTDIDGNLVPETVSVVSGPSHGSCSIDSVTGEVTYTPDSDWNGADTFTYGVCDDGTPMPSECSTALVAIAVGAVNDPPIADAGSNQDVDTYAGVTLDGSGSTDPDNDLPLSFLWTQTGGPPVILDSATAQKPTFVAPGDPAVLTFTLRVADSRGVAGLVSDRVVVRVHNQPPVANAGPDQIRVTSSNVSLDGSGSIDPDHDPLTYLWRQTGGTPVTLSNATAQKPTFVAPPEPAVLTFSLYVTDSFGAPDISPDEVVIRVRTLYYVYLPVATN